MGEVTDECIRRRNIFGTSGDTLVFAYLGIEERSSCAWSLLDNPVFPRYIRQKKACAGQIPFNRRKFVVRRDTYRMNDRKIQAEGILYVAGHPIVKFGLVKKDDVSRSFQVVKETGAVVLIVNKNPVRIKQVRLCWKGAKKGRRNRKRRCSVFGVK